MHHQHRRRAQDRLGPENDIIALIAAQVPYGVARCGAQQDRLNCLLAGVLGVAHRRWQVGIRHDQALVVEDTAADQAVVRRRIDPDDQIEVVLNRQSTRRSSASWLRGPSGAPGAALDDEILHHAAEELKEHFGIGQVTFQVENGSNEHACSLHSEEVIWNFRLIGRLDPAV
jgi:hypothetical protein